MTAATRQHARALAPPRRSTAPCATAWDAGRRPGRDVGRGDLLVRVVHDGLVRPDAPPAPRRARDPDGSFCPHYHGESQRRPLLRSWSATATLPAGYAADDGAALVFRDRELVEVVASTRTAGAWRVEPDGAAAPIETALPTRFLGALRSAAQPPVDRRATRRRSPVPASRSAGRASGPSTAAGARRRSRRSRASPAARGRGARSASGARTNSRSAAVRVRHDEQRGPPCPGSSDTPSGGRSIDSRARPKTSRSRSSSRGPQRSRSCAAERPLELLERDEQRDRAGRRIGAGRHVQRDDRVAEPRLVVDADGRGRVQPARRRGAGRPGRAASARIAAGERPASASPRFAPSPMYARIAPHRPALLRSLDSRAWHASPPSSSIHRPRPAPDPSRRSLAEVRRRNARASPRGLRRRRRATPTIVDELAGDAGSFGGDSAARGQGRRPDGVVVLGSGSIPLARRRDRAAFVAAAGGSGGHGAREQPLLRGRRRDRRHGTASRTLPDLAADNGAARAGWRRGRRRGRATCAPLAPPGRPRLAARRPARRSPRGLPDARPAGDRSTAPSRAALAGVGRRRARSARASSLVAGPRLGGGPRLAGALDRLADAGADRGARLPDPAADAQRPARSEPRAAARPRRARGARRATRRARRRGARRHAASCSPTASAPDERSWPSAEDRFASDLLLRTGSPTRGSGR